MAGTRVIIGANGVQTEETLTDNQLAQMRSPRIGVVVDKETIEADGVDVLTLTLQLQDGAARPLQAAVTLRAILPDHTWTEFSTDTTGGKTITVDAVWPKQYKIHIVDLAGVYASAVVPITATDNYPDATGSAQFTLGEAWRKAQQDQVTEAAEMASLEEAIAASTDLDDVKVVLERMARQIRLLKQYGRILWNANTDDITPYLER